VRHHQRHGQRRPRRLPAHLARPARPRRRGLSASSRRRAPGLRREEVAQLAGLSVDYLARLEQGRASAPSPSVLAPLARALRLSEDERDHLFRVAARRRPAPAASTATSRRASSACSTA